ncbi:hypothetical protein SCHPADRAFT_947696 [Schizopora paradoxa]|uniref:DUF6589 domain-containing protein n=1 Tax=Schizopora paradoxa TaxID=27342 RepID=A0A0H2R4S3_9AGAM|nr:hypothetical protein SCHPADRAFT_947696 [Schizopora paradoxa]
MPHDDMAPEDRSDDSDAEFLPDEDELGYNSDADSDVENGALPTFQDDVEEPPHPSGNYESIRAQTARLCNKTWPTVDQTVLKVLEFMKKNDIDLALLLRAVLWGTPECTTNRHIMYARTALLNSIELQAIIEHLWKPPRPPGGKNIRPRGAKVVMEDVAKKIVTEVIQKEMCALTLLVETQSTTIRSADITSVNIDSLGIEMKAASPTLWSLLDTVACSEEQRKRNKKKRPEKIITVALSMLLYSQNRNCNRLQKIFAMYFKFRNIAIRGYDTLHAMGLAMSSTWAAENIKAIGRESMEAVAKYVENIFFILMHDNVNINHIAYSQRLKNQTHFDSGAAGTVVFKMDTTKPSPTAVEEICKTREEGLENPLSFEDIAALEMEGAEALVPHMDYQILEFLIESPEFDLETYLQKDDPIFSPPPAIQQLPFGEEHTAMQFILRTVHQEEASYEGNDKLIEEWLRQLKMDTPEARTKLALEGAIHFVGDQLTVERLRGLYTLRAEDDDSYDRMDFLLSFFGWFHLKKCFGNTLHKQYLGSARSRGLKHAFALLKKRGLNNVSTKGPFHHHLNEALHHITCAHIRACWLVVGQSEKLSDLRSQSPQKLRELAGRILRQHASSIALAYMDNELETQQDQLRREMVMFNRDALHYVLLVKAIKHGDVGIMNAMIPYLLFRFVGGGNKNYSGEMIELLQTLHRELPKTEAELVRRHCWLLNFKGKPDSFLPHDEAQEHNIKDIKDINLGPNGGWRLLNELSPALSIVQHVHDHIEGEFRVLGRGKKHTSPSKQHDVSTLMKAYVDSEVHVHKPGRKAIGNEIEDIVNKGVLAVQTGDFLAKWDEKRSFVRSKEQNLDSSSESSG